MNRYYVNQNGVVIGETAKAHGFTGHTFWWKIDRKARICIDERTGKVYSIPEDMDLT